jgi:para-nitrobenzyl esterase
MGPRTGLILVALLGALLACRRPAPRAMPEQPAVGVAPVVSVDAGRLRGLGLGSGGVFRGIPYADPPVGRRRWRSPAAVTPWPGERDATGFGYACMQSPSSRQPTGTPLGSEDCLTLNVFSADLHPTTGLPVLVFIHGGFFAWGSSSNRVQGTDVYDGTSLAVRMKTVVVTLNYRLGPLGFLFGNFGLEDQIAALEWVQRNIARFGGDPGRVTLSGHSAGASSTVALTAAPRARGLFQRAIVFSGTGYAKPRAEELVFERDLSRRVGCDNEPDVLDCLRAKSAPQIVAAVPEAFAGGRAYAPFVDGDLLEATPLALFRRGRASRVPMIVGTTSNEFSTMMHAVLKKPIETDAELEEAIRSRRGARVEPRAVLERYPPSAYRSRTDLLTAVWSDAGLVCPARLLARAAASREPGNVWRFVFSHTYETPALHALGAGHGLELPLLFRNLWGDVRFSDAETALGDAFTDAVARFVRGEDPSAEGLRWAPYDASRDSYLELDTPPVEKQGVRVPECDFWEAAWR